MQKPDPIDPFRKPALKPGEKPDSVYRGLGASLILAGAALGKYFIWDVLEAARRQEDGLRIYSKPVFLTALLPMMGLVLVVLGGKAMAYLKLDKKKLTAPQIVFLLVAVGAGLALDVWLKGELSDLGYEF